MFTARDYQVKCAAGISEALEKRSSTMICVATGLGKTSIFAMVIQKFWPKRAIVLAHREELIFQARDRIQAITGLKTEIEMGDFQVQRDSRCDVVVSTVQTQIAGGTVRRMRKFRPEDFGLVVVDECHGAVSKSFRQVIDHYRQNPNIKVLGVTATPDRLDKKALGNVFDPPPAFVYDIWDGIEDGWLCNITQQFISVSSLDYSHIHTVNGDFNAAELAAVMEDEQNVAGMCQPALEVMFGMVPKTLSAIPVPQWGEHIRSLGRPARRFIFFTASVAHAEMVSNIFNRVLPGLCDWVCGKTPKDKRRAMLERFQEGTLRGVVNCGCLTHGYDNPYVEVIFMGRPTKSRALYCQMVGRSTRTLPGLVDTPQLDTPEKRRSVISSSAKPFCRIIDYVGNAGKHKLVTCADILGGTMADEVREKVVQQGVVDGKPFMVARRLESAEAKREVERLRKIEEKKKQDAARKSHLIARANFSVQDMNPFDRYGITPASPYSRSFGRKPSENMAQFLSRRGINPKNLCFTDAGKIIGKIKAEEALMPASDKQKHVLMRAGLRSNVTRSVATKIIDALSTTDWVVTDGIRQMLEKLSNHNERPQETLPIGK